LESREECAKQIAELHNQDVKRSVRGATTIGEKFYDGLRIL